MFETEHRPHKLTRDGAARHSRALLLLLQRGGAEPQQAPATGRICTGVLLRVGNFPPRCEPQACSPGFVRSPLYDSDAEGLDEVRGSAADELKKGRPRTSAATAACASAPSTRAS